jgi:hypothetical protein
MLGLAKRNTTSGDGGGEPGGAGDSLALFDEGGVTLLHVGML